MEEQPIEGELGRVLWRSRRGLLELDLRLVPFARDRYPSLSAADRAMYRKLLEEDDHDILAWLSGRDAAPAPLAGIVSSIAVHTSERRV
jgi:antitoxin CptB